VQRLFQKVGLALGSARAGVAGVIFWGVFNAALELTNTETFCISCHEMRSNVFEELKTTIH
jgi:cytochrome c-type protein NapC